MHNSSSDDPLWYKDAVIYEVHVRAFYDSSGDGMGDFHGLTQKLDYLQDLGITALWILPFFPSPWRDDGYDIADYMSVHPAYGTLRDFQVFLREAHRRGLRVITEVVINHTSDQHAWFQRSRRSPPGSRWREFYVWSDSPEKYKEARIIFKDFETSNWTWDPVANAYYWHRFYSHQPDLNFDNPHVRQAVLDIVDFWFDMGVDAFRLDAIPYLYEREGTNCENLPETHEFLKQLRAHVDSKYKGRMLLAEANQWPEDAVQYFGNDDECHMCFHFPVMPRLFMATRMEDRYPIVDILQQTPPIPANCQWAMFLRNHDELTLEMVTDEERDYMYRVYAHDRQMRINLGIRRRLAPLLGNDRRRIELMNALLFSLPGTPVLYYGDEIGMGDNIYLGDRNGVRTPMQWTGDRNAGFSTANPQKLFLPITNTPEYHYETLNVEAQQNNPNSLLWWMKRTIEHRKEYKAFSRGTIEFLNPKNRKIVAFYRRYENETVLVVANLSRFPQYAELDLSAFKDTIPLEMFGRAEFPCIGDQPYVITLSGHGFYWFSLAPKCSIEDSGEVEGGPREIPEIYLESWSRLFDDRIVAAVTSLLPEFLLTRRWYKSKDRTIRDVELAEIIPIAGTESYIAIAQIDYTEGDPENYLLHIAVAMGDEAAGVRARFGDTSVARLKTADGKQGVLYSALWNWAFCAALINAIGRRRRFRGRRGELAGSRTREFRKVWGASHPSLEPAVSSAEQSNSSVIYSDRFVLKLFRKVEPGINPELEIGKFLTEREFPHAPAVTGHLEYRMEQGDTITLGILHEFVPNQGDAWNYTLDSLSRFFEAALAASTGKAKGLAVKSYHPMDLMSEEMPPEAHELLGDYVQSAHLLGERTAQMHAALADVEAGPDFAPEPFTDHYRQGLYHGLLSYAHRALDFLRQQASWLSGSAAEEARQVLELEDRIRERFRPLRDRRISATRIRQHGDFHLGQLLYTGKDFVIIDFEGEAALPLSERRLKKAAMRDVGSMIRSFQYAAYAALFGKIAGITARPEAVPLLESWAAFWTAWTTAIYLKGYFGIAGNLSFVPTAAQDRRLLLDAFLVDKALHEVIYELVNRPDWVRIPLRGILNLIG